MELSVVPSCMASIWSPEPTRRKQVVAGEIRKCTSEISAQHTNLPFDASMSGGSVGIVQDGGILPGKSERFNIA